MLTPAAGAARRPSPPQRRPPSAPVLEPRRPPACYRPSNRSERTHAETEFAEVEATEVLFEHHPDALQVSVTYLVRYTGDAADFGWVIPVRGPPLSVEDGDTGQLAALRRATEPTVRRIDESGGTCGGGGCARTDRGDRDDFTVAAQGFTGTYEYVVIENAGGRMIGWEDLEAWWTANGWTGLPYEVYSHYSGSPPWAFVALRVVSDTAETPAQVRELPPVRITYAGIPDRVVGDSDPPTMVWPAVPLLHGSASTYRTTIYVAADTRVSVDGWVATEAEPSADGVIRLSGGLDDDPVELWEAYLSTAAAEWYGEGAATTFAGFVGDEFVTRFDILALREAHSLDPGFGLRPITDELSTEIVLTEEGGATAALLLLPLAGFGAWRRRRTV